MKKSNNNRYMLMGSIMVAVAFILMVLFIIFGEKRENFSDAKDSTVITLLDCKSNSPVNPFFVSASALSYAHEVKVTFRSGLPNSFSYNYYGDYGSEALADTARSRLHADYNKYMSLNNLNPESFFPTFDYDGPSVKVNLYGERNMLNPAIAKLFFLDSEEYVNLDQYTNQDLKQIYVSKGFSCNSNE